MATGEKRINDRLKWTSIWPGLIEAGNSTTALTMRTDMTAPVKVYGTTADTTGSIRLAEFGLTLTGASSTNQVEAMKVGVTAGVQVGDWVNAIYGVINFNAATGRVTGTAGAVCAEIDMPNVAAIATGNYTCFQAEMNFPTSTTIGGGTHASFITCNAWGAGVADFDTNGVLFDISGVTSGSGKFWYDHNGTAGGDTVGDWIAVRVGGTVKYLGLYDAQH